MKIRFYGLTVGVFAAAIIGCRDTSAELQEGDILFQESLSSQSRAIQLATHSRYSHMGILLKEGGRSYVIEAERHVIATPIETWIARGKEGHYVAKRLRQRPDHAIPELRQTAERFKGKTYDPYFEWSDQRIYCSELVWKIYKQALGIEIGKLKYLKEFDLSNPIVKAKLKERYGSSIPLDQPVISPMDMFNSDVLLTVKSN